MSTNYEVGSCSSCCTPNVPICGFCCLDVHPNVGMPPTIGVTLSGFTDYVDDYSGKLNLCSKVNGEVVCYKNCLLTAPNGSPANLCQYTDQNSNTIAYCGVVTGVFPDGNVQLNQCYGYDSFNPANRYGGDVLVRVFIGCALCDTTQPLCPPIPLTHLSFVSVNVNRRLINSGGVVWDTGSITPTPNLPDDNNWCYGGSFTVPFKQNTACGKNAIPNCNFSCAGCEPSTIYNGAAHLPLVRGIWT